HRRRRGGGGLGGGLAREVAREELVVVVVGVVVVVVVVFGRGRGVGRGRVLDGGERLGGHDWRGDVVRRRGRWLLGLVRRLGEPRGWQERRDRPSRPPRLCLRKSWSPRPRRAFAYGICDRCTPLVVASGGARGWLARPRWACPSR